MSLHYVYVAPGPVAVDITDRCRVSQVSAKEQAEEGAVPISSLVIDDPLGDIEFSGHRRLYVYEDEAPVDNQVIFNGFTSNERVARGPNRIGAGRQWTLDLSDPNVLINRRIMNGTDANRPAETDLARIQALLTMTELNTVDDDTYVNTLASTVSMGACDYRGQNVGQYIDDCRKASGKNAYILYNEALGQYSLWYDFANSSVYDSGCFITTDEAQEVDGVTTFGYSVERSYVNFDPSRVASGVWEDYDGGHVYVEDATTLANFAAIDWAAPALTVKDVTEATARANRLLHDARSELSIIHVVLTRVPRASVNAILKGQLVSFKSEWAPGFSTYTVCRVLYRQVNEISEDPTASFEIEMDLDPIPPTCPDSTASQTFAPLSDTSPWNVPSTNKIISTVGNVLYLIPGMTGPEIPTPGFVCTWHFHATVAGVDYAGNCAANYLRVIVVGDGTLVINTAIGYNGGPDCLTAELKYRVPGAPAPTIIETQYGVAGDSFTFEIDTEEMTHCVNWVDIREQTTAEKAVTSCVTPGGCGHIMMGFVSADWTLA